MVGPSCRCEGEGEGMAGWSRWRRGGPWPLAHAGGERGEGRKEMASPRERKGRWRPAREWALAFGRPKLKRKGRKGGLGGELKGVK
jgi:hypothetical protein